MRSYANAKILFRKPLLYPAELRDRLAFLVANGTPRQSAARTLSIAHELSGLGSTRVVRFCSPQRSGGDEPGDVATGPQDAEVQGRFEPLGTAGAVGLGSWRASGVLGAPISPLSAALRGRGAGRIARQATWQGLSQTGAGRPDRMAARAVSDAPPGMEREALPRGGAEAPWFGLGLHLG